jgi:hypothetical protein
MLTPTLLESAQPKAPAPIGQKAQPAAAGGSCKTAKAVNKGARAQVRANDPTKPAETNPAGFSFAFAGRGPVLAVTFMPILLGAADATGETNLAAHRCSNFLSRSTGIPLIAKAPRSWSPRSQGLNARGPLKVRHKLPQRWRALCWRPQFANEPANISRLHWI